MLSINTNLSSLIAQNSLTSSTNNLNQSIERMTTGYKINHAKDNAANYSIATNMTTKIGAYQVAEDNALQGLEMMSTSLESLSQIGDKLSRMRALAVQAQNGTYGAQSLNAIRIEASALLDEITRINNGAEFNGIKLFNTGKMDVTNAGKELELNEQGFLQDVVRVDTTGMTKLSTVDPNATLAVGEYSISTPEELAQLATMTNAGLVEAGSTFTLANDIDIGAWCRANEANGGWIPIGNDTYSFSCSFNGNGYTISNLYIDRHSLNQGLFSSATSVKNLKLENVNITGRAIVGAIVAVAADITNCSVTGTIKGSQSNVGGIIGAPGNSCNITYCYANVNISGSTDVGGISGRSGKISNCFSEGYISGGLGVAGIVCDTNIQVTSSKSSATISGNRTVGGISAITRSCGTSGCFFNGSINGSSGVGGISGSGSVQNCIVEGKVVGVTNFGIFTGSEDSVSDSYYYGGSLSDLTFTGNDSTSTIINIKNLATPTDYALQIGTCGDNARSTLSYTTYIDFGELNNVLSSGIENAGTIEKIDNLVNIVSMKQTELGTGINRLESVLEEISTQYENLVSSRSTLRDADIAEVSSEYIRQQILQQASATLMATANQSPAIALQLI